MRFGSVCSGIEAASVAWHPLGWQAAWLAEIEAFPCAVLAHHYPDTPNLGDMTAIARRVLTGEVEAPDILAGGTPCQAFSVAGLRQSLADARGNLTLKFVELLDAIDHVRQRAGKPAATAIWENVPGVLSTKDNAFGCFLAGLAGEDDPLQPPGGRWANAGAVYGPRRAVAWRTLDAQHFGLAQRRRRVFVVASARNGFDPAQVLFEWEGVRRDHPPRRKAGEDSAGGAAECFGGNRTSGPRDVASALSALSALSAHGGTGRHDFESETFVTHSLRGEGFDASEDGTGRGTPLVPVAFDTTQITSTANYSNPKPGDPCHPLAAGAHPPAVAFQTTARPEASPELAYALRADSPSGGGQPQCVAVCGDVAHALNTANNGKGCGEDGTGRGVPTISQGMQVRRLTPEECEALQGFPRGYTAIPWRSRPASECPDGPRYKALGNSWAVPCARWVGRRVMDRLQALARRAA